MSDGKITGIFALVAVVAFGAAWWSQPTRIGTDEDLKSERIGEPVFADFNDPAAAASFQIIKYDESMAQLERFEVVKDRQSGVWKLPSHGDYPADAAEQVRDATTPLIGMRILSIPTFDRGDHQLYGVVNPDDDNLTVSETGVGMLVRVKDAKDEVLASLIIGKEVEQAQGQHYARAPTEDAVYVVELDTSPFTTEFQAWIKGELLGVRSFDITSIGLRDYAVFPTQQAYSMTRNFDADLSYDRTNSKWQLDRLISYKDGNAEETPLDEGMKLNSSALNNLRTAVQDLKIVDVRRKPTGLASDLKAEASLMENQESLQSLVRQGFIPQESGDSTEIFATGGETIVGTDDGVEYVLRFGETTQDLSGTGDEEEDAGGLRRYLLVMARMDDDKFPAPDLEPLPETVEEMRALQEESDESAASSEDEGEQDGASDDDQPSQSGDALLTSPESGVPPSPDRAREDDDQSAADEDAEDDSQTDAEEATQDPASSEETDPSSSSDSDTETEASDEVTSRPSQESQEELEERLEALREEIAKENQRKIDERNEKMDEARTQVQELNARFADWYYVVSDSVYKKLKIERSQLSIDEDAAPNPANAAPGQRPPQQGFPQLPPGIGQPQPR